MITIDPKVFLESEIPEDTKAFNAKVVEASANAVDPWTLDIKEVRAARRSGEGMFPLERLAEDAYWVQASNSKAADNVDVPIRVIPPDAGFENAQGCFLHIHGGGWVYGGADLQDERLKVIANGCNLVCLSVEYRLAPENPWPACIDDCVTAANWVLNDETHKLPTQFLAIGGESAGGHLAALVLQEMTNAGAIEKFAAAVMVAGAYDLTMTPSSRNFGELPLILKTSDVQKYSAALFQHNENLSDPTISPLNGNLTDMPPAHFTVGTKDALLDDSVFMATTWAQYQPDVELEIYPGGPHVFQYFHHLRQAQQSQRAMNAFLNRQIKNKLG